MLKEAGFGALACAAVGGAVYFQDGEIGSRVYQMQPAQAIDKLYKNDLPPEAKMITRNANVITNKGTDYVRWVMNVDGNDVVGCTANVRQSGETQSAVAVSCESIAEDTSNNPMAEAALSFMEIGIDEFIDSTLSNRPFNNDRMKAAAGVVALKAMPAIQQQAAEAGASYRDSESDYKDRIEKAELRQETANFGGGGDEYSDY